MVEIPLVTHATAVFDPYIRVSSTLEMMPLQGDAVRGLGELFGRDDIVDAQWRIVEQILDDATPVYPYEPGTWGPTEAEALIGVDGPWRDPKPEETK